MTLALLIRVAKALPAYVVLSSLMGLGIATAAPATIDIPSKTDAIALKTEHVTDILENQFTTKNTIRVEDETISSDHIPAQAFAIAETTQNSEIASSAIVDPEITDLTPTTAEIASPVAADAVPVAGAIAPAVNPNPTEPDTTGPDATEPDTTGPDTTGPDATQPDTTEPALAASEWDSDPIQPTASAAAIDLADATDIPPSPPNAGPGRSPALLASEPPPADPTSTSASDLSLERDSISTSVVQLQGVYLLQGDESSARLRATGIYVVNPSLMFGATVDLVTGESFANSEDVELVLNELYATASLPDYPNLRLTLGLMDLTSYFDRNSFAKDAATHFFNPAFQTNPALSAAGLGSRPGALVSWDITDYLALRGALFSSSRNLGNFALDGAAAELALRFGNVILRGTYATNRDAGREDGFREAFLIDRGGGSFGVEEGDREVAYGLNAEVFFPELNLGLFGRYGWYDNRSLDLGGQTLSLGMNLLDVFLPDDRLGLAYGRQLSNNSLRQIRDDRVPDVWELFYDLRLNRFLRAGVTLQGRNEFSETVFGFRLRTDFRL